MKRREFILMAGACACTPRIARSHALSSAGDGHILVDPRIELMSVVHLLSGYFLTTQSSSAYREEASAFFAPYRGHPVVATARDLADKSLAFDAVPDLLLRLTEPPALAMRGDLRPAPIPGIPDDRQRAAFLLALRDFARVSEFNAFFASQHATYRRVTGQIAPIVAPNVRALQSYTGLTLARWQVIAGLLMHDGGFGPRLGRRDGTMEIYALIGPNGVSGKMPSFGDRTRLQDLVVHELAHSLVNPIAEQQPGVVARYAARYDGLRSAMKKEGYGDWPTVVNEHVVRAVTARIAARQESEDAGRRAVTDELRHGFAYVPAMAERLRRYEGDRRRWPTLPSFYPTLLEAFDEPITAT